jgi:antitoxin HicB
MPLSEEDGGGFLLTMPDFPGLMADGETIEEAVEDGREIPAPESRRFTCSCA